MARTEAVLPGGARLSDYLSVGVIARVFPLRAVRAALRECDRLSRRRRGLPAEAMVYYVIAMGLFRTVSAREVLRCLAEGLRWARAGAQLRISGKSSISRARTRLGTKPFERLKQRRVRALAEKGTRGAWYRGLRLAAYDGTTLEVPDEERNREAFGLPRVGRGEAEFPKARVTALLEVGTGAALAWEQGPYRESEQRQAMRLQGHLQSGMLLLADRGYLGAELWRAAAETGADLLWRVSRQVVLPVREILEDGSFRSQFAGVPVRVVEFRIEGSDLHQYRLLTTRMDPEQAPAVELAALYHQRWEVETACDQIKAHLLGPGPTLRSKTPELVRQEIEGLMLAHYAVRHFLHEAALEADEDPDRLSFTRSVQVVRPPVQNPGASPLWT